MQITRTRRSATPVVARIAWLSAWLALTPTVASAAAPTCQVVSGERRTPVIELYTSEGCSSCPPADQWMSTLKGQPVVAQAFHVAYWDYIGWKDRFASPAFTTRQRELALANRLSGIYTPQVVRNGRDWPQWRQAAAAVAFDNSARANIRLQRIPDSDNFEAHVAPAQPGRTWTAYWTVTEHGHASRVTAGENKGESLKHDFVVRQFVPVGEYTGTQVLKFHPIPAQSGHPRQINLVVSDARSTEPLQAVSLSCS